MEFLSQDYWNKRYLEDQTGWDLGAVSPPLKAYIDLLPTTQTSVLIPGAGNAYEAEYLYQKGFGDVHIVEFSEQAMLNFMTRVPSFPFQNLHLQNFFDLVGSYDLIIEQTFFCALDPKLREAYKLQMHRLLKPGGLLIGLLFDIPLNKDKPPFGGSRAEYAELFDSHFEILEMDTCHSSIKPRAGNELFIRMKTKKHS